MKTDSRTENQMRAYWLFQEWIAQELNDQGISMAQLVMEIQPKATKNSLHDVFKKITDTMYQKDSTKLLSREEMQNCLDVYMDALARNNLHIEFPDSAKQNLLQFYN